jgi:hypothetical protein
MKFNIIQNEGDGNAHIEIDEGRFKGIAIQYGIVRLEEKDNNLLLNFNYDVVKGTILESEKEEFNNVVGNLLVQFLEEQNSMIGDGFDGEVINDDGISYIEESGNE